MKQAFFITVNKSRRLFPCKARRDKEASGFFGFHDSDACPDCRYENHGWELWGQNGHPQGCISPDQNLQEMLDHRHRLDPSLVFNISSQTITWMK